MNAFKVVSSAFNAIIIFKLDKCNMQEELKLLNNYKRSLNDYLAYMKPTIKKKKKKAKVASCQNVFPI